MKTATVGLLCLALIVPAVATAEEGPKTLASTIEVYVFPTEGQEASQQSKDEAACYSWAVENTGTDPFELAKRAEAEKLQAAEDKANAMKAGQGAAAGGAVKGAVKGALIGEIIDDDAGEGAAYGAIIGARRARRRGQAAQQQATAKADQKAQNIAQATAEQVEGFKKAFSVCLEAKDYLVKF
jgi:hypothetical protein